MDWVSLRRRSMTVSAPAVVFVVLAGMITQPAAAATPAAGTDRPLGVLYNPIPGESKPPVPTARTPATAPSLPSESARPLGILIDDGKTGDAAGTSAPGPSASPPLPVPTASGFRPAPPPATLTRPNTGAAGQRPLGVLINRQRPVPTVTRPEAVGSPAPLPRRPLLEQAPEAPAPAPDATGNRPLGTLIAPLPAPGSGTPAVPIKAGQGAPETPAAVTDEKPDQPNHLVADEVIFDRERKIVTATGNVEVRYGARRLVADRISYDQDAGVVTAEGNVTLLEPSGEIIFGDSMDISGDLRDAVVQNIGIILEDRSRIAGTGARRSAGRITEMRKAAYSPCNLCKDNPERPPLWQIKAVRVIHDKDAKIVEYRDAWLEMFGFPVAYTPYFRHPDPTVKRQTGLLFPSYGSSSDFGIVLETPFFWNISPSEDATITPILMTDEAPVLSTEYRNRLEKGSVDVSGSVTDNSDDEFETTGGSAGVRGHILAEGRFDVNKTWRWGFDLERSSDDTYMRRYGFGSDQSLESQLFVEGFRNRSYFSAKSLVFQGLAADDNQDTIPVVMPLVDFNHQGKRDRWGGRTIFDANLLALTRSQGTDTRRISIHPHWERPFISSLGDVYNLAIGFNADLYHVNSLARSGFDEDFTGFSHRAVPYVSLDWRKPMIRRGKGISQIVEPVTSIVLRPYGGNSTKIPNEDSVELEFDETNLFSDNRFTGIDRIEGGPRINYGLKWAVFGDGGGSSSFFLGQSYRLKTDDTFSEDTGLEDNLSDIVGKVQISPGSHFDLLYRTQFSSDDFSPTRNKVRASVGVPAFSVSGSYIFLERQGDSEFAGREELNMAASSQFDRNWRGELRAVRDIDASEMRSLGMDVVYENECVVFKTSFQRTFFEDRDIKPTDAITFHLILKTIGEAQTGFSRTGN